MKKRLLLILISISLTACYTTKLKPMSSVLDPYIGKTENEVLIALGPPSSTVPDAAGGKIITYEEAQTHTSEKIIEYGNDGSRRSKSVIYDTKDATSFFINPAGKVYFYKTNLPGIPYAEKSTGLTIVYGVLGAGAFAIIIAAAITILKN